MVDVNNQPSSDSSPPTERELPGRGLLLAANVLSVIRLIGAGGLIALAWFDLTNVFLAAYFVLLATDWVDGKLASLSGKKSTFGARLDSVADITLFLALLVGVWLLRPELVDRLLPWIAAAVGSYAAPVLVTVFRFRRLPGFHAWSAKVSWYLVNIGLAITMFIGPVWPMKFAMAAVVVANLEAACIAVLVSRDETDVKSLVHVLRRR